MRLSDGPSGIHILIPETWDHVPVRGKEEFAGVIKLRVMRWGDDPELPGCGQCNHKSP